MPIKIQADIFPIITKIANTKKKANKFINKIMELRIITPEPVAGYWDGGKKSVFNFSIDQSYPDGKSKIGSWDANFYKEVKTGRTDKMTLANFRRTLAKNKIFKNAIFEYIS